MKLKFYTVTAILTLSMLTACGSGSPSKKSSELSNPTSYEKSGYTISVSDNWGKTNNENTDLAFFYKESENDSFTESLNVMKQDLSSYDYTLDTYKDLTVSQYEELDYTIESCEKITIDNNDCYEINSYTNNDDTKICCKQVFTLIDKTAYLFTFAAEDKDYDKLSDEVDAIFNTIIFTGSADSGSGSDTSSESGSGTSSGSGSGTTSADVSSESGSDSAISASES